MLLIGSVPPMMPLYSAIIPVDIEESMRYTILFVLDSKDMYHL